MLREGIGLVSLLISFRMATPTSRLQPFSPAKTTFPAIGVLPRVGLSRNPLSQVLVTSNPQVVKDVEGGPRGTDNLLGLIKGLLQLRAE